MSLIGNLLLKEIVGVKNITDPADILSYLHQKIINILDSKDGTGSAKDGMDIAICSIDYDINLMEYSGAFNPLYVISNRDMFFPSNIVKTEMTSDENILYEIAPDRIPIGLSYHDGEFTNKEVQFRSGDTFYIFTDGFVDQFGGRKDTKYKYSRFRRLILNMQDRTMDEQNALLDKAFKKWKGEKEQIDDILIIGFRVN